MKWRFRGRDQLRVGQQPKLNCAHFCVFCWSDIVLMVRDKEAVALAAHL